MSEIITEERLKLIGFGELIDRIKRIETEIGYEYNGIMPIRGGTIITEYKNDEQAEYGAGSLMFRIKKLEKKTNPLKQKNE